MNTIAVTATSLAGVLDTHCSVSYHFCRWGVSIIDGLEDGGCCLPMVLKGVPLCSENGLGKAVSLWL